MPIIKTKTTPTGIQVTFHKALKAEVNFSAEQALATVAMWPTKTAHDSGMPFAYVLPIAVEVAGLTSIDAALLQTDDFRGGVVAADESLSLSAFKAKKWAQLKEIREAVIDQPKPTSLGSFDGRPADQDNLNKVIGLARIAIARGFPDAVQFTLADNSRPTFTLAQLETAALEIGVQVQEAHSTASALRQQIESATTPAQVAAVSWPA